MNSKNKVCAELACTGAVSDYGGAEAEGLLNL